MKEKNRLIKIIKYLKIRIFQIILFSITLQNILIKIIKKKKIDLVQLERGIN